MIGDIRMVSHSHLKADGSKLRIAYADMQNMKSVTINCVHWIWAICLKRAMFSQNYSLEESAFDKFHSLCEF